MRSYRSQVVVQLVIAVLAGSFVVAQQGQTPPPTPPAGQQQEQGRQGGAGRGRGNAGVQIGPGEECPPGMTEWRTGSCRAPELPVPNIVDYRPRSTLVTPAHPVPRAKFPAIDYHAHIASFLRSPESLDRLVADLDKINVGLSIAADSISGDALVQAVNLIRNSRHKDRVRVMTGINFANVGPGWAEKAVAQLEADVKAGAVGIGEISKSLGLRTRKADGTLLKLDDPDLDPVWAAAGRLGIPVFIHTAEPQEFFEPIDNHNERMLELALFGDRRYPAGQFPRFEELMTQRDNVFKKHPKTTFVAAHLGWHGNDLARLGRMFDAMPNVVAELGAVLYDIGRQPRFGHDFMVKYQDRLLFGKDTFEPAEFPYYWRVFETNDEYFDYYRNYHAFWKLYGVGLPDDVLKKVYYKNALRVTPGLPKTGWPQ
ncbi:MAG TPA: amidohydrolase family protein [Vicinamibacterales bacterium]|nr:amidohydrolase family protein [Vicinamibacterales bacterium]